MTIPARPLPHDSSEEVHSTGAISGSRDDIVVLRRPTYDILLQLKAEADAEQNHNVRLISALEDNDRQSGVYEGGLKTWEGALDLASLVNQMDFLSGGGSWHIVELGAGSALPSIVALTRVFAGMRQATTGSQISRFHFTLSDYNDEVLRLSTWANVLLASKQELNYRQQVPSKDKTDSLEINEGVIQHSQKLLKDTGISFNFISGPWGEDFANATTTVLGAKHDHLLILASETIYDLSILPVFTDTVINLLRRQGNQSKAWVAAKKLYFGVGGGVDAFVHEVNARGGTVVEILKIKQGVSRVVLEVTVPEEQQP